MYTPFKRWAAAATFETLHDGRRQQRCDRVSRAPESAAAIIGAHSARSPSEGGNTGFGKGTKVKGRKHHVVADTLGLRLAVTVATTRVQERDAAGGVVAQV